MSFLQVFFVAFLVSYLGSIPPGTINVSVMQLSMKNHRRAALFLGLAASMVEFVYAGATVKFQQFLITHDFLKFYFQLITATVLIVIGVFNLLSKATSTNYMPKGEIRRRTGFKRGLILGILNPLTIPFWLAVTTYLETYGWITLASRNYWAYISGLAAGTFFLLICVDILGSKFQKVADNSFIVHKIPGMILTSMGVYNMWEIFT